ncbi:MAG: spore germination protein GerW family protein [Nitriliruptoraceae bacterium]
MSPEPGRAVPAGAAVATDPVLRLASRVVGEPVERDGAVVVPLIAARGGSGGGSGSAAGGDHGQGAGWGAMARPVGAFVLEDGRVRYQPVIDVTRLALGAQFVAAVALLTIRRWLSTRS